MSIGLITGGIGLLNSLGRNRAGQGMTSQGSSLMNQGIGTMSQTYNDLRKFIQDRAASGAYNADEVIRLSDEISQRNLQNALRNTAAQAALVGFKPGDSAPVEAMSRESQASRLQGRQQRFNIEQMMRNQQLQDQSLLANAGMQFGQSQIGAGQNMFQLGQQQQANSGIGETLGFLSSMIPTPSKKTVPTIASTAQNTTRNPLLNTSQLFNNQQDPWTLGYR